MPEPDNTPEEQHDEGGSSGPSGSTSKTPDLRGTRRPRLNEREREARAGLIAAKRLTRTPIATVMKELGISRATYYRGLDLARQKDLYDQARDFILADLLPRALKVYAFALEHDDIDVARHILEATVLARNVTVNQVVTQDAGENFIEWRARITAKPSDTPPTPPALPVITLDPPAPPLTEEESSDVSQVNPS